MTQNINLGTKKMKAVKPNPSADLIGQTINAVAGPIILNYRKGKQWQIQADSIECTNANFTGRRLNVTFKLNGAVVLERRVYREWFESMTTKLQKEPVSATK